MGPLLALVVLAVGLFRARALLRSGLLVARALSYFLLMGFADGSGSRLQDGRLALAITLGVIPLGASAVAVLLIRHVEAYGFLRRASARLFEALAAAARGNGTGDNEVRQPPP